MKPSTITRPAVSVMRHASAASNTLASPLMVTGEVTFAFTAGIFSVIAPFADVGTDGLAVGVDAAGEAVTAGPGVPADPQDAISRATSATATRPTFTST